MVKSWTPCTPHNSNKSIHDKASESHSAYGCKLWKFSMRKYFPCLSHWESDESSFHRRDLIWLENSIFHLGILSQVSKVAQVRLRIKFASSWSHRGSHHWRACSPSSYCEWNKFQNLWRFGKLSHRKIRRGRGKKLRRPKRKIFEKNKWIFFSEICIENFFQKIR